MSDEFVNRLKTYIENKIIQSDRENIEENIEAHRMLLLTLGHIVVDDDNVFMNNNELKNLLIRAINKIKVIKKAEITKEYETIDAFSKYVEEFDDILYNKMKVKTPWKKISKKGEDEDEKVSSGGSKHKSRRRRRHKSGKKSRKSRRKSKKSRKSRRKTAKKSRKNRRRRRR